MVVDLEHFPTSPGAQRMIACVTAGFYDRSYVGKWLYQVMGTELDEMHEMIEGLTAQYFPETATWGLALHEIQWGLPVRENLTFEERRSLIYQKRDSRIAMTPYQMEAYLVNATGFAVRIYDANDPGEYGFRFSHPNVFRVAFIGEGTLDTRLVRQLLDRLKQSHTMYILDDWVIAVDNHLERVRFYSLFLHLFFRFWGDSGSKTLNGDWLLDGSITLSHRLKYEMRPCCIIPIMICKTEQIQTAQVVICKDLWYLDGTWNFEDGRLLDAEIGKEEF